jgi:hypothetical protein
MNRVRLRVAAVTVAVLIAGGAASAIAAIGPSATATSTTSIVAASAADVGTISSGLFSGASAVTWPAASRSISTLRATTDGMTLSSLTFTVTGKALDQLDGQDALIELFDETGAPAVAATGQLALKSTLTNDGTTAVATIPVSVSAPVTSRWTWSVVISGTQLITAGGGSPVMSTGNGTLTIG